MTIRHKVSNGLDVQIGSAPPSELAAAKSCARTAVLGRDFPSVRFEILVGEGDRVKEGQALLRDRRRPTIVFTSPANGSVGAINRGARRTLVSVRIDADGADDGIVLRVPPAPGREAVQRLMLESGLWTSLRRRPYGVIPAPDAEPAALLVTAIDSQPLAPDPAAVISRHRGSFGAGLDALALLRDTSLYLCKRTGAAMPSDGASRFEVAEFTGPHPAGLPGTHISALAPIGLDASEVWHIGYQDVISLGYLMLTGRAWFSREISIAGPAVSAPRVVSVPLGASVTELLEGELVEGAVRVISGSVLGGEYAVAAGAYLGRLHNQLTVVPELPASKHVWWRRLQLASTVRGRAGPFVPIPALERVAPPGVLVVPFLRALLVGDVDRARQLGAMALVEEDVALLSYVCPSKNHYGLLLRRVLDELAFEKAA